MAGPLLETKLHAPHGRQGAMPRARLSARLGRSAQARLTVVSAPAGFGKTTLLTQWLADLPADGPPAVAWVSLDANDNDAATFWTYVITALQRAVSDASGAAGAAGIFGAAALGLLAPPQPLEPALTTLLNELQTLPHAVYLVLDDYHMIETGHIHDGVGYLLDNLPSRAHLVLATRADPPLALPRLRARGDLVEVRSADLRFTVAEAADYLTGPMGLSLTAEDIATLADRTEGWAAALQLAALSLQERDDPSAAVARFAGDDRFIVDYLVDEVLARQSQEVRDFLLDTSILDRLTGPLCDAVTGRPGGAAQLVELERANLFLVPLDDRRQWWRYHHLFADVLRAHLGEQQPGFVSELHMRAAAWFQADGAAADAIRHALAANDFSGAADLMELAVPMVARERREPEFTRWVRALPESLVRQRPVLAVAFVGALAQASAFDSVGERLDAIEASLRPGGGPWPERPPPGLVVVDEAGYRSVPATIELYRAALALSGGDLSSTAHHAREALSLAPADSGLIRAAAGALGGLASWTTGDLSDAHAAYAESVRGLASVGYVADVLGCSITLGDIERTRGELKHAVQTYQTGLDLARPEAGGVPLRGTADMHVGIAGVLLERGDLSGAADELAACEGLGDLNGLPQNPYRRRLVAARLRQVEGDLDAALELLDEAERVYNGDFSPNVQPVPAVRARLQIRRGELSDAEQWGRKYGPCVTDDLSYLREYEHVTLARLLLARHQAASDSEALDDAIGLLHRLLTAAEEGSRTGTVVEVLALLALAQQARGNRPAALAALRRALTLGQPEGYVRIFADEGPPMATLLKALAKEEPVVAEHARRLVAATAGTDSPVPVRQTGLIEPLSDRELDVLRLLATDLGGPDIARRLHVSLNTMRTHSGNIFRKLQVNNRRGAVRRAVELDLLPPR